MTDFVRWVADDFDVELADLKPVHHGADVAAEVWQVSTATGEQYAVKWSGGGTDVAPKVTAFLVDSGVQGIPGPVRTRTGELWSVRDGKRLSLAPWITGDRAADTGLTTDQWTSYGALLAEVHAIEPPAALAAAMPRLNPINAQMPALTKSLGERFSAGEPQDALEAELAATWLQNQRTIARVVELTQEFARRELGGTPVICHADPHLGNVLVAPEQLHLIDWDDVVLAPVEQDLLFMLGGMRSVGPTTQAEEDAFFKGYGPVTLDHTRLTYYRAARALEDIALWAQQAVTGPDRETCLHILRGNLGPDSLTARALRPSESSGVT
ncbi:phosphotransferase enzyme family protein [Kribbella sp. VKM Ac-2568]|uniref:phosphotransferase enzyme family protein n=1 Tax=Kribbella sp. VKM Ac-2568 TaxID=2512219 RepID=UPI0010E395B5|nr:aminoglycoside phosphotransferase family protein [Kribbella sp. VKM Ac-2568]TCM51800.1 spectinomycin phosphotransferase [Kribbella sp. VKM Ac-2568]